MKKYKRILAAALTLAIAAGAFTTAGAAQGAVITQKDETVYARLTAEGAPQAAYIVNHFQLSQSGSVTDYGHYEKATNMTDLNPVSVSSEQVTFNTESDNFFYQGYVTDANLPWLYNIAFTLDGAAVTPEQLAGADGELEINLAVTQNEAVNAVFFENYMQQITVTLDTAKARNIMADGATAANAGKNRMLVFTVLPGGEAEINITADVIDFEMPGIDIAATPFSMDFDMPDTGGMVDEFSLLADAITELDDGVARLADGAVKMQDGAKQLADGSAEFNTGLATIDQNAGGLTGASAQINEALTQMSQALAGTDLSAAMPDMSQMAQLPEGLAQLAGGLTQTANGMAQLNTGYAQAFEALDTVIAAIPEGTLGEEEIQGLYAVTDASGYEALGQLVDSYTAALTVKGTYAQTKEAFAAVSPTLETMAASVNTMAQNVSAMAGQIGEALAGLTAADSAAGLTQLTSGITELAQNYAQFHGGLVAYTGGIAELADGYEPLNTGVTELSSGIGELASGIRELNDGTSQMADETADLPGAVQTEIDNLTGEYGSLLGGNFQPVSFASDKNENISFVQFVFKTAAVEAEKVETTAPPDESAKTFWERLKNLF